MLGRKTYTRTEIDGARAAVADELAAWQRVGKPDAEATYFTAALLALDRHFVHRVRAVTGKDTDPLSEVELLVDSVLDNGRVVRASTVVRYVPEKAVVGLAVGDRVALTAQQFDSLATAFLEWLETKFLDG